MHEVGIMQTALEIAERQACQHGAERIVRLGMRIGALAGVEPDALEFAFSALKRDTLADGAKLEVEYMPIRLYCSACDQEFSPQSLDYRCPQCAADTQIRAGRELDVAWLELA